MNRWFQELLSEIKNGNSEEPPTLLSDKSAESDLAANLEASMERLEANRISIAVLEDGTMRVVQEEEQTRRAVEDGFTIYSPKDMYHFVQLGPADRRILHSFKLRFGGTVEWKSEL